MAKYTNVRFLDANKNIMLVKDEETGELYVKKYISDKQRKIYEHISLRGYSGVPKVVEIFPEQDYFVLIEEYIKGQSLQELLDSGVTFPKKYLLTFARFMAKTLTPIHRDGLVHRDITPSNIICRGDELYLVDFGISRFYNSKRSGDTELLGTRDYAAPEQFGFGQSTNRTDIYAIGMVMLTLLYCDSAPVAIDKIEKKVMSDIKLLSVISRCTEIDPDKRYESVGKLLPAVFRAVYWPFLSVPFLIIYAYIILFALVHIF